MSEQPKDANEHCPGPQSEQAGKQDACAGCPNQQICATLPKVPKEDPSLPLIGERMQQINHKLLVLSGKGGVGKSTVSTQIALYLAGDLDVEIALVDFDLTGPSIPRMVGLENDQHDHHGSEQQNSDSMQSDHIPVDQNGDDADRLIHESGSGWTSHVLQNHPNLQMISTGLMLPQKDTPVIWRGARKHEMITRFLRDVSWGDLDFLICDLPPGTSDEHLSVTKYLPDAQAVLVTTPQEMSLQDVRKEINFCRKVGIQIIGVVENMAGFVCPSCGGESDVLPRGGNNSKRGRKNTVEQLCQEMDISYLGSIPLDPRVVQLSERGGCMSDEYPDSVWSKQFDAIMNNILNKLN
ncbi:hypothetical protein MIR68_001601 [Amoeboaphelidium protococcarum]|nr:hypothetical protein MIR68_001601 [Amoeboaphelidium protococcarum]